MVSRDYEEFIAALNERGVRYLVIGAHAVALHARPRATKGLAILLDPTPANARRALAALRDFFRGSDLGLTAADLADPRWIIHLGVAPTRIDLLPRIAGCSSFAAAWKNRVDARFGAVETHFLGLEDLIRAKEAAGRAQDQADVAYLRRAQTRPRRSRHARGPAPRG